MRNPTLLSMHTKSLYSMLAMAGSAATMVVALQFLPRSQPITVTITVAVLGVLFLPFFFAWSAANARYSACVRVVEEIGDSDSRCPFCAYVLTLDADQEQSCSECGASVPPEGLKRYWKESPGVFRRLRSDRQLLRECGIVAPKRR